MNPLKKHQPKGKPDIDPRLMEHVSAASREEWQALVSLVRFQWPWIFLLVLGLIALLYVTRPVPPASIRLATGQSEASMDLLGQKYAEHFARHGVRLELVQTAGAFENVDLLRSGKVDAAFSLGGMVNDEDSALVSLGSIEYQPLWIFYRGAEYAGDNPADFFRSRTFSINVPGSGTRSLSEKILALHGITVKGNRRLATLPTAQGVSALKAGQIDGIFLVAAIEARNIQRLLAIPDIRVLNLVHAHTYNHTFKFLEPITLPRGALDPKKDLPSKDLQLVATTTTVLTTHSLHPALQQLFLTVSKELDRQGDAFFSRVDGFPARVEHDLALSDVAKRYYAKGPPVLHGYVPFWIATFFGEIWLAAFAAFAIGYPVLRVLPAYRIVYARLCMTDFYEELKVLDRQLHEARTPEDMRSLLEQFDHIEKRVGRLWVPNGANESFYKLRVAIGVSRDEARRHAHRLAAAAPGETSPDADPESNTH